MSGEKFQANNIAEALARFVANDPPRAEKKKQATAADFEAMRIEQKEKAKARTKRQRAARRERDKEKPLQIAILDMETDPFDNVSKDFVQPFLACLYAPEFDPIIIWEDDAELFAFKLLKAIDELPGKYTIYAHNGGKFDYMFLVHKLRGKVSFKGRGIMSADIGNHQIRDSYHILPDKLANMKKAAFDYGKLTKKRRNKHRDEIIEYCVSDCENLYFYVSRFIKKFGKKISVGAAAIASLSKHYEIEKVSEGTDEYLRPFFFGGRVECIQGAGYFSHGQKLYDINSAYPDAMARLNHPVGSDYHRRSGEPNGLTAFIKLECKNNGALMSRLENGDVSCNVPEGVFFTTKWEYQTALELGLISDVRIIECVDNFRWTNFHDFVVPSYDARADIKEQMRDLDPDSPEYAELNSESTLLKFELNNAYGKTCQNPRRFKEHYFTEPGNIPPIDKYTEQGCDGWEREHVAEDYWIWSRASPVRRYLNVGTGASITGAVRSKLMRAIHAAVNPVYCDTDSIICDELRDHELHGSKLGAWDLEKEIAELVICGKKLYAYKTVQGKTHIKSKGASGLNWQDMLELLIGQEKIVTNMGPTLTRHGGQSYISRRIRATAKAPEGLLERLKA